MKASILKNTLYTINFRSMILAKNLTTTTKIAKKIRLELSSADINFSSNQTNDGNGFRIEVHWSFESHNYVNLEEQVQILQNLKFLKLAIQTNIECSINIGVVL